MFTAMCDRNRNQRTPYVITRREDFVTWRNPKWLSGTERGDNSYLACKFNDEYGSQIMAYLAGILHI
jgi:hypothetical protein